MASNRRDFLKGTLTVSLASMAAFMPRSAWAARNNWDMADEYTEANLSGKAAVHFQKRVAEKMGRCPGDPVSGRRYARLQVG